MSNYQTDVEALAAAFKALGHPQRLKIFLELATCCAPGCCETNPASMRRCAGELGANLALAASTVSHHLKELRLAGLMHIERRGRRIECWLDLDALQRLAALLVGERAATPDDRGPSKTQRTDRSDVCRPPPRTSKAAARPRATRRTAAAAAPRRRSAARTSRR